MRYEWDDEKRRDNVIKHGVDFAEIENFIWESALVDPDEWTWEQRFIAVGFVGGRLHVLVYTRRGSNTRIISFRKANRGEVWRYDQFKRFK